MNCATLVFVVGTCASLCVAEDVDAVTGASGTTDDGLTTMQTTTQPPPPLPDCAQIRDLNFTSGVYTLSVGTNNVRVYCDMDTDGGGWAVLMRRQDGSVNFTQDFANYSSGFGDPSGEFWLGLDNMNLLTMNDDNEMRVDLWDCHGVNAYEKYGNLRVGSGDSNYTLNITGPAVGTAGDSLQYPDANFNQNLMKFSTFDVDNDNLEGRSCVDKKYYGLNGFWFNRCGTANLNGKYYPGCYYVSGGAGPDGIFWYTWRPLGYSASRVELKVRPAAFPTAPPPTTGAPVASETTPAGTDTTAAPPAG